jgi:hypothetical protein
MPKTLMISIDERGVARLTLTREDKHNAMSAEMIDELTEAASALGSDGRVRVVVLAGAGKSFCAGGDLEWMRAQFKASRAERIAEARRLAMMFKALNELPKPLIGCVHGSAFGGGIGLISVCDTVIASEAARFGLTEVRLGLIPATISPYVVAIPLRLRSNLRCCPCQIHRSRRLCCSRCEPRPCCRPRDRGIHRGLTGGSDTRQGPCAVSCAAHYGRDHRERDFPACR